jgi:hypothetical protein
MNHDPMSSLVTVIYPRSHPCKSLEYGQLSFQIEVNHQEGTIDSRVDRNEQDNKSETYQGYREKMVRNTIKDIERIRGPQRSIGKCSRYYSREKSSICVPHYVQSDFGGVISIVFPHITSCLSLVLDWGPG